jgi:signal peptidase I
VSRGFDCGTNLEFVGSLQTPMEEPTVTSNEITTGAPSLSRRIASEVLPMIVVAIVTMAARSSLADHYIIPSGSMEHTLAIGDHVFVDKLAYGVRVPFTNIELAPGVVPQRGEVIIFDSPEDGTRLIKRVVATGGDHVSMTEGALQINGHRMRETSDAPTENYDGRVATLNLNYGGGPDIAPSIVPNGMLLVVGDARGNSRDGRFFGLVPAKDAYGKAISVIYRKNEGLVWKDL